jgi:hypothetical protein
MMASRLSEQDGIRAITTNPLFDPIRNEPQFKALMARLKFPPQPAHAMSQRLKL